ncbi:MAG: class I SAM-dependent methyltransferase [Anaerolineae bacterium]
MYRDSFRALAPYYERLFRYPGPVALLPLLALEPGMRLLDIGGGTAQVSAALPADCTRVVLDPSLAMLRQGRGRGVLLSAGLAERLPFADGTFDRCLFVDSFHHLLDHGLAATEALRVLRPGGRLLVEEPDIRHPLIKLIAFAERLLRVRSRFLSPADMERVFRGAGAGTVTVHPDGAIVRLLVVK